MSESGPRLRLVGEATLDQVACEAVPSRGRDVAPEGEEENLVGVARKIWQLPHLQWRRPKSAAHSRPQT